MAVYPPLRIVYFGTPHFSVPALRRLAEDERYDVCLVVTQPDRRSGRGQHLTASPVRKAANELGIAVYQPSTLKTRSDRAQLIETGADLFVVAAFGLIFGRKTLEIPRLGCINLHASLLPKYRGASPIPAAIACGERETGISLMQMDAGLDTGPVIATASHPISPEDTTESLTSSLSQVAAELAANNLDRFVRGELQAIPQASEGASLTRPLAKSDGWLDWSRPALELESWVRAMWPWPRAWTTVNGEVMQIHRATLTDNRSEIDPGTVLVREGHVFVTTSDGGLVFDLVQFPGGRPVTGKQAVDGRRLTSGLRLAETGIPDNLESFVRPIVPSDD